MSKKHEMTEQEWEAYRKAHPYDDILEAEQSKIARDKISYARRQSRAKARATQRLRDLAASTVPASQEDDLDDADDPFVAERARRNVRTRKRRLQSLARREDDGGGASAEHPDGLLAGNE